MAALTSRDKGGRKDRILVIAFGVCVSPSGYEVVGASLELPGGGELIRSATQCDLPRSDLAICCNFQGFLKSQ